MAASHRSRSPAHHERVSAASEEVDAARDVCEPSALSRRVQNMATSLPEPVTLRPIPVRLPPFPQEGLLYAMAFDGELYSKAEFFAYYGDAHADDVWTACQVRTHEAACFVHIWFNWTLEMGGEDLMLRVGKFVRGAEWLEHDWWRVRLVQLVFRALALRDELMDVHQLRLRHDSYNNAWGRTELNRIAMQWTAKHIVRGKVTPDRTRRVLRVFWQHWFGHKDFAMIVATQGVRFWKEPVASLSHFLQTVNE